jgi:hypothetical protein
MAMLEIELILEYGTQTYSHIAPQSIGIMAK